MSEELKTILAEEVLKVSPEDIAMADAIRSETPPNNYAKISLAAMQRAYELGHERGHKEGWDLCSENNSED